MAWRRREKDVTKGKVRLTLHLNQVACVVGVKSGRGRGIRAPEFPHPFTIYLAGYIRPEFLPVSVALSIYEYVYSPPLPSQALYQP